MPNIVFSEASGLNESIYGKSQAPIRMFLEKRGEAWEQNSVLPEIFSMETSQNALEKYTSMTAMDGFEPVGELGATPKDGMQEGFSKVFEHMTWKDSFALSREIIEDSKTLDLKKRPEAFISGYYRTREKFGAALLGGAIVGGQAALYKGKQFDVTTADKQPLFAAAHPSKVSGMLQSNLFGDAFSADALGAMECAMQNFCGDNDEVLDVAPNTIIIPNQHSQKKAVFAAIGADKDPDTANNGFNYQFGRWNVIVWPYLNQFITSGTSPWILADTNYSKTYGGAVWLDRTALEVDSYEDKNTHANVWTGFARFTAGFNDWRWACCGGIAGASELSA